MELENYVPIKIKGYKDRYLVNKEKQQVYSKLNNTIMRGFINGGYKKFRLKRDDGKYKAVCLHRIMIETFGPDRSNFKHTSKENPQKVEIASLVPNHIDGNKLNNSVDNLEWCTRAYNNKEAYRLGLRVVSEKTIKQFLRDCVNEESIKRATENLRRYRAQKKETLSLAR